MSTAAMIQQAKAEAAKPAQHTSQSATQSQQIDSSEIQTEFADLRPQATTQRKLQDAANHSPQSRQLHAFQQMAKNSARATQLKSMSAMMNAPALQRVAEEEDPLQAKMESSTVQREEAASAAPKPNNTGLPDNLKSGIESLSGMSMDHVKVHYNSAQPAQLNAHAYAQGSDIHVAPGQEQHVPHEAWHVVQQAQGRVRPTMQMKAGVAVNDDVGLESEADVMGAKALGLGAVQMRKEGDDGMLELTPSPLGAVAQRQLAEMMNNSPRMVAQRSEMNAFSGDGQTRSAPIQRVVDVDLVSYKAPGGKATKALVVRIQQTLKTAGKDLKRGWITALKDWVKNAPPNLHNYRTEDDLLAALEVRFPPTATVSSAKKRKADIEQQDQNLVALTTGIDDRERKRAKLLTTHSSKAWGALVSDVSKRKTVTDTSDELEALNAGVMDATSNVQSTSVPFEFLAALGSSGASDTLDRMDFNFGGTEVSSHGFESPGDRSIAPRGTYTTKKGNTKSFNAFNYNTVKIGNNIGTYAKHQGAQPSAFQGAPFMTLNSLEKFRLPGQALGTSIKRDLMNQGLFTTPQGIGQNHPHANVEFLGATAGSGLTRQQQEHMRYQQELSNTNILNSAYLTAPNQELGLDTGDGKARTTPSAIYKQLDVVMASDADDLATKTAKKQALRRNIKRLFASTEGLTNVESDDEVSDAEP